MKNSRVVFNFLDQDNHVLVGYKDITCNLIFDVKMNLTRKARYVAGWHLTDPPSSMAYESVVSQDSVRIDFLVAASNKLDIVTRRSQTGILLYFNRTPITFYSKPKNNVESSTFGS